LTITTFAGPPEVGPGAVDGTGSAARFNNPYGVAADNSGNVYVADTSNHTIRKITPVGLVGTLAGLAGSAGSADGTGSAARFYGPRGAAVDSAGNVYVADYGNHTIRKITPAGVVSTLAGLALSFGSADGTGSAARFYYPSGVAVDGSGNVYVGDWGNHTIRKITPAGVVSTFAGLAGNWGSADGTGSAARFTYPYGVAVDGSGNVYVADQNNHTIRTITPAGVVSTLAGTAGSSGSADGTGSAARFNNPEGVAVDGSGNLYVVDAGNATIRKITPAGVVSTLAGTAGSLGSADGTGSAARFYNPRSVAVDGAGNAYIADQSNHTIRKIAPGGVVSTWAGAVGVSGTADGTGGAARFCFPNSVAVDGSGNIIVADTSNFTIRTITPAGVVSTLAGMARSAGSADGTGSAARFNYPYGVAVDSSGNVYVADCNNCTIRQITLAGVVSTLAGLAGSSGSADGTGSAARFYYPRGVAVDGSGNVYVADTYNHAIRKITPTGEVSTLAGLAGSSGSADGTGSAARFYYPRGVAVDASFNVYVADSNNHTIRKITPAGVVSTLAGWASSPGSADGTGSAARFAAPSGVVVDSSGNVYVADFSNHTIRKITPAGLVSTMAGLAGNTGSADGTGSVARFSNPAGVAVDGSNNIYVADQGNHTIRKGAAPIADLATIDQASGAAGATRHLDTSPQTAATWQWSLIRVPADSAAVLSSTTTRNPTFTPDVLGLYVFRLVATDAPGGQSITTVQLSVNIGPASTLVVAGFPSPTASGTAGSVTVTAKDALGQTAIGYRGTVHFSSTDTQGALPGDYTFLPSDNGTHTFILTLKNVGTRNISATDAAIGTITGTQSGITVNARAITVKAATDSKTYDGSPSSAGVPTIISGSLASGDTASWTQIFDSKNVGTGKMLTPAGTVTDGNSGNNYSVTFVNSTTGAITAKPLSVTAPAIASKSYDGTATAGCVTVGTLLGFVNPETVSATAVAADYPSANVGSYAGTVVTYTLHDGTNGGLAANYSLAFGTATGAITANALAVSGIGANNKTYDGTTAATLTGTPGTLNGIVGTEDVSLTGAAVGAFDDKNVGTNKAVTVSGQSLTGADAGNYTLIEPSTTADITAKALTVSGVGASNKTYDGNATATLTGTPGTLNGIIGTEDVSLIGTAVGTFADKNVGISRTVTVSSQSLTGADASNYTLTEPTTTTDITAKALTVSGIGASNKTYDGNATATLAGAPGTLNGIVGTEDVSLTGTAVGTFDDKNVGTSKTVTVSGQSLGGADAGNYTLTESTLAADIMARAITVNADAKSKVYGAALPALTYTYSGLASGDASVTVTGALATSATAGSGVGTYSITQGTLAATGNYTIGICNGANLTVTAAPLTVTADAKNKVSGEALPTLTYIYTGLVNGDASATFTGALATTATAASGAGTYTIAQGMLAATGNYTLGAFNAANLTVTAAIAPAITSASTASATKGAAFSYTITASGSTPMTFGTDGLPAGLSLSGDTISGTSTVGGVILVTIKVTNIAGSDSKTLQLTIAKPIGAPASPPVFSSGAIVSSNTGLTGQEVTFTSSATDSDGDILAYTWDFGDGTTSIGASAAHTFTTPGIYTVTVTTFDGTTSTSQSLDYMISAAEAPVGDDNGGDPSWDAASGSVDIFVIQKAALKLSFTAGLKDSLQLSGTIPVAKFFKPANRKVTVVIGSFRKDFTLNAKGQGTAGVCKIQMKGKIKKGVFKATPAKFTLSIKGEPLLAALKDFGFADTTTAKTGESHSLSAIIMVDVMGYEADKNMLYKAMAGKSGSAK
jgi:hypothetical protein